MSMDVNVSDLNDFSSEILHKYIEEIAKIHNLESYNYHVDYICDKGYTSSLFRVSINCGEEEEKENLSVVIKTLINTTKQELFYELHKREVLAYTTILKKYDDIQNKFKVIDGFKTNKCYFSNYEKGSEVIIIEDLNCKGFELSPDFELYDYKQIDLAVRELAKFHGLTFIFEKYEPKMFIKAKNNFKDLVYNEVFLNKTNLMTYYQDSYAMAVENIHDDDAKTILEKIEPTLVENLRNFVLSGGCNVFCHGDFWSNNIMFKYEQGIPTEARFIDYQTMRYANPITDLYYLIYLNTDSEFRHEFLQDLQTIYYDSLNAFLSCFDIDIRNVYPREQYHEDLKNFKLFGFFVALMEFRLMNKEEIHFEDEENYNNNEANLQANITLYKERINDIVNEFKANGTLNKINSRL